MNDTEPNIENYPLIGGTIKFLEDRKDWIERELIRLQKEKEQIDNLLFYSKIEEELESKNDR